MMRKSILGINIGLALLGVASVAGASPVTSWDFKAYGGFAQMHTGDFPSPGYHVLLTPLSPRDHQDMGAFYWSPLARPSLLGINQKKPLVHGQNWKAVGQYYGEKNPVQPGVDSIHGKAIGEIVTDDDMGEVIGWMTHYNNWIPDSFEGAKVAVNYHLQLFEPGVEGPVWDSGEMYFFVDVFETQNNLECCPDGNYNEVPPNDNGCADRFRVGVLKDYDYDGDIDADDLELAPEPGACFDVRVDSFTDKSGAEYEVYLNGFWEEGEAGESILTGEGWSPESELIHFEVRAQVWQAGSERQAKQCVSNPSHASCVPGQ